VTSALIRKSWTDLSRRPVRAVLTTLTLALAVASFGLLALPSLMNRAMNSEVKRTRLYDLYVPVDAVVLSPTQLRALGHLPNVTAVSGRTMFATRTLIGGRRVDTEVWGVPNFADQPVDQVITSHGPGPNQLLVDVQDATHGISSAGAGDTLSVQTAAGSFRPLRVAGTARSVAFNQDVWTNHLVLYATQSSVERVSGLPGVNLLEFRVRDARQSEAQATVAAVRAFLSRQPNATGFANLPTVRSPGDYPLKAVFDSRSKILDILIVLAVLSAALLLANTIRTLVAEQTREIGVMRAIGAGGRDVRNSYLRTAALLGVLGALIGAVLGMGLTYLLVGLFARQLYGISPAFAIDWPVVVVGALAGVAGAVLTAWPTLQRVLRTPVHEALANEGLASQFGASPLDRIVLRSALLPAPVRIGVRNIARQKGRSGTTVAQIALAVATLLGLASLALAVSQVTDQSWNVLAYDITLSAQQGGNLFGPSLVNDVRSQPGISGVEAADWSQMTYHGQTLYALGVHAHTFVHEPLTAGSWFTTQDEHRSAEVAVVGSAIARRWHLQPGARVTLNTAGGARTFRVVGVGGSQADNGYNVYTTLGALQAVTGHPGEVNSLLIRSANPSHPAINALAVRLESTLANTGHVSRSQIMYAGRASDKASSHTTLLIVEGIGLLIVAISMLGLVNAITMSIIERTREIGVLRCLGVRARDLRRIFRTETISLALIGFVLAIPLGWLIAHALRWLVLHVAGAQLPAPYTLANLGLALIGTLLLAVLVVTLPLRRATRLHPGDAIRYN